MSLQSVLSYYFTFQSGFSPYIKLLLFHDPLNPFGRPGHTCRTQVNILQQYRFLPFSSMGDNPRRLSVQLRAESLEEGQMLRSSMNELEMGTVSSSQSIDLEVDLVNTMDDHSELVVEGTGLSVTNNNSIDNNNRRQSNNN